MTGIFNIVFLLPIKIVIKNLTPNNYILDNFLNISRNILTKLIILSSYLKNKGKFSFFELEDSDFLFIKENDCLF